MDNFYLINFFLICIFITLNVFTYFFLIFLFNKKQINNFIGSTVTMLVLIIITHLQIIDDFVYLFINVFAYLGLSYLFLCLIYTPESSVRFKIISILINNKNKMKISSFFKKYNDDYIYYLRFKRMINSKTIFIKNGNIYILNKITEFFMIFFKLIRAAYLKKKIR